MTRVEFVIRAIAEAYAERSKLPEEVLALPGMSSRHGRHLLNNLCAFQGVRYLEVGVWLGSTLISALYGNMVGATHLTFENYSESPENVRENLIKHWQMFFPKEPLWLVERDCFSVSLKNLPLSDDVPNFNVYFYDGNHTRLSQELALMHFWPVLADEFVLVVDDYAWRHVREATQTALRKKVAEGAEVLFSAILCDELDVVTRDDYGMPADREGRRFSPITGLPEGYVTTVHPEGWWNGMYVAVVRKGEGDIDA